MTAIYDHNHDNVLRIIQLPRYISPKGRQQEGTFNNMHAFVANGLCYFYGSILTWVKEDNSLQSCILIVVYLNILEGLNQLVQDSVGYPENLRFRAVPVYHAAITCRISAHSQRWRGEELFERQRYVVRWGTGMYLLGF